MCLRTAPATSAFNRNGCATIWPTDTSKSANSKRANSNWDSQITRLPLRSVAPMMVLCTTPNCDPREKTGLSAHWLRLREQHHKVIPFNDVVPR